VALTLWMPLWLVKVVDALVPVFSQVTVWVSPGLKLPLM
jgi:hypothetical protein